ncbi:hypothetical protein [Nocardiopsis flavescens]
MTDGTGAAAARGDAHGTPGSGDTPEERFASLMRQPRRAALISGALVPVAVAVNLFLLDDTSGALIGVAVVASVVCVLAVWNVVNFSPTAVARLEDASTRGGGRFTLWKEGTGGHTGVPFAYGAEHQRFGVLDHVVHGLPVEIGHLASQVSARHTAPTGRRHAYVVVRLPQRLPHMIVSFGHLSRVLGVRVVPDQWHRSQRVDVGGGRRFRLFVGDGGEQLARSFLSPDVVRCFQRVGRHYDIEIEGRDLYLFGSRSAAAGTGRRWNAQRELIEDLAATVSGSGVWEIVRRRRAGRGGGRAALRADVGRAVALVFGAAAVIVAVLSLVVLKAAGLLD